MKLKKRLKEMFAAEGYTILEVVMAMAVMTTGMMGMMEFMSYYAKSAALTRASMSRDVLSLEIARYASNYRALKNSVGKPGNTEYTTCLPTATPVPTGNICTSYDGTPNTEYPFVLYDPSLAPAPISGLGPRASPAPAAAVPMRYSTAGAICPTGTPASSACPIEVFTTFEAYCP